jgi:hypothetical protein
MKGTASEHGWLPYHRPITYHFFPLSPTEIENTAFFRELSRKKTKKKSFTKIFLMMTTASKRWGEIFWGQSKIDNNNNILIQRENLAGQSGA